LKSLKENSKSNNKKICLIELYKFYNLSLINHGKYNSFIFHSNVLKISLSTTTTKLQINSTSITKFIKNVGIRNKNTAKQYQSRLLFFERFVKEHYHNNNTLINNNESYVDKLIHQLKDEELDPYDILNDFCLFLQNNYNLSSITFRDKITTVKTFFEYNDIEISPRKFKLKVRFPKIVLRHKEAIDKEDIIKILNGCSNLRLKTYVMLLAATGCRAVEALSIRNKDLDLESYSQQQQVKLTIRGEFTKTKVDRHVYLTREIVEQLKIWLNFKYRTRRICHKDEVTGKTITEYRTPENNPNELVFSQYQVDNPRPDILYENLAIFFSKTLDRIGMGSREDGNEMRRKITFHSFRRFAKSTISDLGYADYSEWFIGHSGSTYWRKKDNEKAEIFNKIEPYLTFLNIPQLERQGADLQTKIEELQLINHSLRDNDKIKEDALAHLSDQLLVLSERIQQLERKQSIQF
jgi:integrase